MPELKVRKRLGRRSGGLRFRLNRYYYRNRARIAVIVAFLIAGALGVFALSAISDMAEMEPKDEAVVSEP